MNTERLNHLITILEGVERANLAFNLDNWVSNAAMPDLARPTTDNLVGSLDASCGTACCAMGYAALDPDFRAEGLSMTLETRDYNSGRGRWVETPVASIQDFNTLIRNQDLQIGFGGIAFDGVEGFRAAAAFFDIAVYDADTLFSPDSYHGRPVTPERVIERIRDLLSSVA